MLNRTLLPNCLEVLQTYGKMLFLSGPRQVGKTTLAQELRNQFKQSRYLNWDILGDKKTLLKDPYFFEKENRDPDKPFLVVFDEIHKYARWKNYLKGVFDGYGKEFRILVTGSGRLDLYKKGGDSLLGRYRALPLFPLTMGELTGHWVTADDFKKALLSPATTSSGARERYDTLFRWGGFPEPFSRGTDRFYGPWLQERKTALLREDIRDATAIRDLSLMEALANLLPDRVGSPLSVTSLREDLDVSFETVRDWLLILENFYYLFRLRPFVGSLTRSLKKEAKAYLYDWAEVEDPGARFENLVAVHLLKAVRSWSAAGEGTFELAYLRDKEKREADFVLLEKGRPFCVVECKTSDLALHPGLIYFQAKHRIPVAVQLVHQTGVLKKLTEGPFTRWIISADRWLSTLP